ncbi:MAG TPA: hypothetical protein PKY05_05975, partial [Fibrobacteria bacterium]|nr:hypothetical protein [Fibrobacteria bacterium]
VRSPALAWEFAAKPSDFGGWLQGGSVSPLIWNVEGSISGSITGGDPKILSPDNLGVDISNAKYVRIRMRNRTSDTEAQIFFVTEAASSWDEKRSVRFPIVPNDAEFREYVVNIGSKGDWKGILRQLRLDPAHSATSGGFDLDYIRIQSW